MPYLYSESTMSEINLASRWRRFFAALLDFVLVIAGLIIVLGTTRLLESPEPWTNDLVFNVRVFAAGALTYLILNGALLIYRGQTIGKFLLRMRIVETGSENRAPIWILVLRSLFIPPVFVAIMFNDWGSTVFLVALVWYGAIFYKHRKCLHDYLLRTDVIRVAKKQVVATAEQ